MPLPRLLIVVASTRPGRIGLPVAQWFRREAEELGTFDVGFADLAEENLPMMDEPKHPRLRDYQHEHTLRWAAKVEAADAIAFVLPEYNYSFTAPLKNAFDYLHVEWRHKPCILVSYGGVSAGTRAAAAFRVPLSAVGAIVVTGAVSIPFVQQFLKDGAIEPNALMRDSARVALAEAEQLAEALAPLRGISRA
jgi:NAD(P)H-dependent FMN reductase